MWMRACAICKIVLFKVPLAEKCGASVGENGVDRDQERGCPQSNVILPNTRWFDSLVQPYSG